MLPLKAEGWGYAENPEYRTARSPPFAQPRGGRGNGPAKVSRVLKATHGGATPSGKGFEPGPGSEVGARWVTLRTPQSSTQTNALW